MAILSRVCPTTVTEVLSLAIYDGPKTYRETSWGTSIMGQSTTPPPETVIVPCDDPAVLNGGGILNQLQPSGSGSQQRPGNGGVPKTPTGRGVYNVMARLSAEWHLVGSQSAWETYAASVAGLWVLCAKNTGKSPGQKIFVQTNYARLTLGLSLIGNPEDLGANADTSAVDLTMWVDADGTIRLVSSDNVGGSFDVVVILQKGRGVNNVLSLILVGTNTYDPVEPQASVLIALMLYMGARPNDIGQQVEATACVWRTTGETGPVVRITATVALFVEP